MHRYSTRRICLPIVGTVGPRWRSVGLDILERVAQDSRYLERTVQDGAEIRNINGAAMPGLNRQITAEYDKHIITRQPDFDERKTRADFRKLIPNLRTVISPSRV
jgi:hypothetical protein